MGYVGIQPKVVEVNPLSKAELKETPDQSYRKVPIAMVDEEQVNGSDEILDTLLQNKSVQKTILSKSPGLKDMNDFTTANSAKDWVAFANDDLATLLYPNICSSLGDSYTAFGYVNQVDPWSPFQKLSIRAAGSVAMYMAASRVKSEFAKRMGDL